MLELCLGECVTPRQACGRSGHTVMLVRRERPAGGSRRLAGSQLPAARLFSLSHPADLGRPQIPHCGVRAQLLRQRLCWSGQDAADGVCPSSHSSGLCSLAAASGFWGQKGQMAAT